MPSNRHAQLKIRRKQPEERVPESRREASGSELGLGVFVSLADQAIDVGEQGFDGSAVVDFHGQFEVQA